MSTDVRQERATAKAEAAAAKARSKAMRPWYKKKRFVLPLAIVAIAIIASVSSGGSDKSSKGGSGGGAATEQTYTVGQTAQTSDFEVTLRAVEDPMNTGNEFDTPKAGNRFVGVEFEVKNVGSERQTLSTLLGAELIDSLNRPYDIALAGLDRPQLDGEVVPGQSRRGWITFEVPADATGLKVRLKGSLTAQGSLFVL